MKNKTAIKLFDTETQELKPLLDCDYIEHYPVIVHEIEGTDYLFSVYSRIVIDEIGCIENQFSYLFNTEGNKLFDFELSASRGRETDFEQSKKGFGITYKLLKSPIKRDNNNLLKKSTCLIDRFGNFYGEFTAIAGKLSNTGVKSHTVCPKFFEGKMLCSTLPTETDTNEYLVIIDKEANRIETKFHFPFIGTRYFNQFIITDKKIFGSVCLLVLDQENKLQLIDLNGEKIPNMQPLVFKNNQIDLSIDIKAYFISQKK